MFCQNCGHKKEGTERFCARCGASLGGAAVVRRPASASLSKILGIAGGVFLIIVLAVLLLGRKPPHASSEAVVYSFLTAYYKEFDASQMLELSDPQALEALHDDGIGIDEIREDLQAHFDKASQAILSLDLDFVVERTELQNGSAKVDVLITYTPPEHPEEEFEDLFYFTTVERDGRWYIYEIDDECIVDSFIMHLF